MSNIFKNLSLRAVKDGITPNTQRSREWFRQKALNLRRINRNDLMKEDEVIRTNRELVGTMVMFFYDPKTKEQLPFYDAFPLVIIVGPAEGGFYGINLHYLPPTLRAKFLDALMDITNNKKYDDTTRFRLSYNFLKKASNMKYFKPCFKHYLTSNIRGNFGMISGSEYEIAVFLPTADWKKASANQVYRKSRELI